MDFRGIADRHRRPGGIPQHRAQDDGGVGGDEGLAGEKCQVPVAGVEHPGHHGGVLPDEFQVEALEFLRVGLVGRHPQPGLLARDGGEGDTDLDVGAGDLAGELAHGRDAEELQGSPRGDVCAHGVRYRPPPLVDEDPDAGAGSSLDVTEVVLGLVGLGTVRQAGHVEVPDHGRPVDWHGKTAAGKLDSGQESAVVSEARQVGTIDGVVPALHLPGSIGHSITVAAVTDSGAVAGGSGDPLMAKSPQNPASPRARHRFPLLM